MLEKISKLWRDLQQRHSRKRFQARFHRRREARQSQSHLTKSLRVLGGGLLMLGGLVMLVLPGPGLVAIVLGASLLAGEFLLLARWLDQGEVRLGGLARWSTGVWKRRSRSQRIVLIVLAVACLLLLGSAACWLLLAWWPHGG